MVLVAVAMTADLDLKFQSAIADDLPSVLVNPSGELEESEAVADELADVRGGHGAEEGGAAEAAAGVDAARLRRRARLHRHAALVQHARRQAALDRRADRAARAGWC